MDSFEFNKIAMSVLGVIFIVMSLNFVSDGIFHSEVPEEPGYLIEVAESSGGEAEEDTGPAYEPIAALLANASVEAGQGVAKRCAACHTFEQGGANKVGPALYGVVNRDIASVDGFGYSGALTEYGNGKQWTYDELNGFLWKPKTYVKGTSMGFAGLKDVEDRADIVAYLRSLSATPAPLPDPEAAAADTAEETANEGDAANTENAEEEAPANAEATESDASGESDASQNPEASENDEGSAETENSEAGSDNAPAQEGAASEEQPASEEEGASQ